MTTRSFAPSSRLRAHPFCVAIAGLCGSASAQPQMTPWAVLAQSDIAFTADYMRRESISAVYPMAPVFERQLTAALQVATGELPKVNNFEGYRQVMKHFLGNFNDMHLIFSPSLTANTYRWPGFIASYRGHRYVTAASTGAVADNVEITSCDGHPIADLAAQAAVYEEWVAGLESTRSSAAPVVFRDAGSPFVRRPVRCIIGGKDVQLDWQAIPSAAFDAKVATTRMARDKVLAATPFGPDGTWIRMGIFNPATPAEGQAFHKLIDIAPQLRDKAVIVLDVRANGGGPYEWMMAFIRSLYGSDYADYYARARLEIAPVYRTTPAILAYYRNDTTTADTLATPHDGAPFDEHEELYEQALRARATVFHAPANPHRVAKPARAPTSVVKAQVYVLTDYRCGSVCIGFVDEMKRLPGVRQIGVETFIDSHTGTPMFTDLPGGNGTIAVPTMTRDGRTRGDNAPQKPDIEFMGNIADTEAVKAWVRDELFKRPAQE